MCTCMCVHMRVCVCVREGETALILVGTVGTRVLNHLICKLNSRSSIHILANNRTTAHVASKLSSNWDYY